MVVDCTLDAMKTLPVGIIHDHHVHCGVVRYFAGIVVDHADMVVVDLVVDYTADIEVNHSAEAHYSADKEEDEVDHFADMEVDHSVNLMSAGMKEDLSADKEVVYQ